jgi:hypothetical protein
MDTISDRITATIPEFARISGLGRSKIYELVGSGVLRSFCVGRRRLVEIASYRELVERQRAAPAQAAPPRRAKARTAARP